MLKNTSEVDRLGVSNTTGDTPSFVNSSCFNSCEFIDVTNSNDSNNSFFILTIYQSTSNSGFPFSAISKLFSNLLNVALLITAP